MYNYSYVGNDKEQFSAVCLEIDSKTVYVSFEGTDHLISGWEEDFDMLYKFPVLSQKRAINYLNKYFTFSNKRIIVGGHSKGGNLAMTASIYCNRLVMKKIINVYNNDGPGFRDNVILSSKFNLIKDRIIHIVPNYSVVGLIFKHLDNYVVIKSNKKSIMSHSVISWEVSSDKFIRTSLSDISRVLDSSFDMWIDKYSDYELENFVKSLFFVFKDADIYNLLQIYDNKKLLFSVLKNSSKLDKKTKNMIKDFIFFVLKYYKDYELFKLKEMF